jgi:hypothetical protein
MCIPKSMLCISLFLFCLLQISSCKKDSDGSELIGTWNVTKVQGQLIENGNPGITLADNSPTGYVLFNKNGTGTQDYSFTIFGLQSTYNSNFVWRANESEITIERINQPDLIWRRITNEPDKQEATYTTVINSTQSWDYTLTLEK